MSALEASVLVKLGEDDPGGRGGEKERRGAAILPPPRRAPVEIPTLARRESERERRRFAVPLWLGVPAARGAFQGALWSEGYFFGAAGRWLASIAARLAGLLPSGAADLAAALSPSALSQALLLALAAASLLAGAVALFIWIGTPPRSASSGAPFPPAADAARTAAPEASIEDRLAVVTPRGVDFHAQSSDGLRALPASTAASKASPVDIERSPAAVGADPTQDLMAKLQAQLGAVGAAGPGRVNPEKLGVGGRADAPPSLAKSGTPAPRAAGMEASRANAPRAELGRAGALGDRRRTPARGGLRRSFIVSQLAMGQLKFARALSGPAAAGSTEEMAAGFASSAFEQNAQAGGAMMPLLPATSGSGIGAWPGGSGTGGGSSTPGEPLIKEGEPSWDEKQDLAYGEPIVIEDYDWAPDIGPDINVTPYQADLDGAKLLSDEAAKNENAGTSMIGMALKMIASALMLMKSIWTIAAGIALMAAAFALMMKGKGKKKKAKEQAQQAKEKGEKIGAEWQKKQAEIVKKAAEEAAKGKKAAPPPWSWPVTDVRGAAERLRRARWRERRGYSK